MKTFEAPFAPGDTAYVFETEKVYATHACPVCEQGSVELKNGSRMRCSNCGGRGTLTDQYIGDAYRVRSVVLDDLTFERGVDGPRYLKTWYADGERYWWYPHDLHTTAAAANAAAIEATERANSSAFRVRKLLPPLLLTNS